MAQFTNPFLRGTYAAQAANQQAEQNELQGLATLLKLKQAQEEHPLRQDLLRAQAANELAKPEDRALLRTQNNNLALERIRNQVSQFEQNYQLRKQDTQTRIRNATTSEERLRLEMEDKALDNTRNDYLARVRGAEAQYNIGDSPLLPSHSMLPTRMPAAAGAPAPATGMAALMEDGQPSARPPAEQSALLQLMQRNSAGQQGSIEVTPEGGITPMRGPMSGGPAMPVAPPPVSPLYRDEGSRAYAAPMPVPAAAAVGAPAAQPVPVRQPATPEIPKPPEYAGWSQARKDAFDSAAALAAGKATLKADVGFAGGRESTQINRVINGGNQVAAALSNIIKVPIESSTGIFGTRGQSKGLMNAGVETLTQKMTTQDVQTYQILTTGIQRSLAAIEASGLAPTNALTGQMEGVVWREGWSNFSKLMALSETRQIVEKGMEVILSNPRVDPEQKKLVQKIVTDVQNAVPWTNSDLINLQQKQLIDPNATLEDVIKAKKSTGAWSVVR